MKQAQLTQYVMQEFYNPLRYFEEFAKNKEQGFISQLIKHIKRIYKIDDGFVD